jgi:hypothetical protein
MTETWLQPAPTLRRTGLSGLRPLFTPRLSGSRSIMDAPRLRGCHLCSPCLCRERRRLWPELIDPAQDRREQGSGQGHLGQLEHDVAAVAHHPGADLGQLLAPGGRDPCSFSLFLMRWPLVGYTQPSQPVTGHVRCRADSGRQGRRCPLSRGFRRLHPQQQTWRPGDLEGST